MTGNLLSVKEYINQNYYLTEYKYDESGNVTKITDAKGNSTVYEYNMFGIGCIVYPDTSEEHFTYDCIGNVVQKTHGNKTINYHYNTASQLVEIEYPDSLVTFTYDANGNRVSMVDPGSSTVCLYDSRNRLSSETKTIDGFDYTTSYVYDAASNVVSIIYPDGTVVNQNYDDLNRVTSVEEYAQFLWNENSQLQHIAYQNGVTTDYVYNVRSRPIQIVTTKNGTDLLNLTYVYDAAGNILQIEDIPNGQLKEQWDYTYDSLNRLLTAVGGLQGDSYSLNYVYDSTGNRIQLNSTVYTYDEMNELLTQEDDTNCTYTYDEYGNCISKTDGETVWEYHYDDENRLSSVKENGQITEQYVYDGDGKRIKKIDSDSVRIYIYSGITVLYEINMTTQMDAVYIYGSTGKIAKRVNDIREYYHIDHLGSTKLVTSENGATVEEIIYEPFGKQISASEERYTYNGKELDATGFYYYGARYYDPETGRFLTRDPLVGEKEVPQTLNRYTYCLNNPLTYIDPIGAEPEDPQDTVENVFKRLQGVDLEELAEIQELIDAGKELEAFMKILELLGFAVEDNGNGTLSVKIGENEWTMKIDNNLKDPISGLSAWGLTDHDAKTISINFTSGKVGDVTLTVLHEVCHAVLGPGDQDIQHDFIYSVEHSYLVALRALGVEFSTGGIQDNKLLPNFVLHIRAQASIHDPNGYHRVPPLEVAKILTRRWKRC